MSIELQQEVLKRIEELADRENRTPSEVVSDALEMYSLHRKKKMSDIEALWAIVGLGESEEDDVSERDEEILASEVDPIRGWRIDDTKHDSA